MRLLIAVIMLASFSVLAQRNSNEVKAEALVFGSVLDSLTGEGMSFATISFIDSESNKILTGGICDENGLFSIDKVPLGSHKLLVEYIGYSPKIVTQVRVFPDGKNPSNRENFSVDLGVFFLNKSMEELLEVELVEEKAMIVQGIDRKIFNVDQDMTNTGESAIELMEKLPSVQVDVDGNLSLRGSNQVRLYVDGKPSMLSASDLLETLPSSMIESVELITNPSAKFSPEGMAGIINLVLKKNKDAGFNGNLALTVSEPNKNTFTTVLNRRTKKLNLSASYSLMDRYGARTSESEKHTYFSEDTFHLYQDKWSEDSRKSQTFKAGIDYTPTKKSSFSLNAKYVPSTRLNYDTVHYKETTLLEIDEYDRLTQSNTDQSNLNIDFNADRDWDSGLHADLNINQSFNTRERDNLFVQTILMADSLELISSNYPTFEQLSTYREDSQFQSKLDFEFGNNENGKWEWGLSARTRSFDQNQFNNGDSTFIDNSALENHFIFEDEVFAAYFNFAKSFGLWSFQTGLRAEQFASESYLENTDSTYVLDYFKLYPSVYLNYSLDENTSLQASYSRRVNRPGFYSLNPFPEYSDPFNLRMGNPYLRPEFVNSFEFGYQKFDRGNTLSASIYAKDVNDLQRRFIRVDSNSVSTVTYLNFEGSLDIGLEFMWSKKVSKEFNFMLSSNVYYSKTDATNLTTDFDPTVLGMSGNFNFSWQKNGHKIQYSGWGMPGRNVGQGKMLTMFSSDLAYSRPIFSEMGKMTLKVSDVFNTRAFGIESYGPSFDQSFYSKRLSRYLSLTLSYKFGEQSKRRNTRRGNYGGTDAEDMGGGFY